MSKYNATFVSIWDGGLTVESRCRVNKKTRMITKIGKNDIGGKEEMLDCLEREYVVVDGDDREYKAMNVADAKAIENDKFYYD